MKTSILLCLIAAFFIFTPASAAEPLRIVTIQLPPYGFVENNEPTGLTFDLGNLVAYEAGYKSVNRIAPLARCMENIAAGTADLTIMFPNPEIEKHAVNTGEILPVETIIIGRAGAALRTFRDVRGKMVAAVRGAKYDDRISKKNGIMIYPTDNYEQSLKMLLAGRVDMVVGPDLGIFYTARKMKIPKHALSKPLTLSTAQGCVFVSRETSPATVSKITETVKRLRNGKAISDIVHKYSL